MVVHYFPPPPSGTHFSHYLAFCLCWFSNFTFWRDWLLLPNTSFVSAWVVLQKGKQPMQSILLGVRNPYGWAKKHSRAEIRLIVALMRIQLYPWHGGTSDLFPNPSTSLYGHTRGRSVLKIFMWPGQFVLTSQSMFPSALGKIHQLMPWCPF